MNLGSLVASGDLWGLHTTDEEAPETRTNLGILKGNLLSIDLVIDRV